MSVVYYTIILVYTVAIYYKIFSDFFPSIWVGRRSKSHDVWCWIFGNWRFALPVSFESVTNRHKSNMELNHKPNNVKTWSRSVIEVNLHFLWLGLFFINSKLFLFCTKVCPTGVFFLTVVQSSYPSSCPKPMFLFTQPSI